MATRDTLWTCVGITKHVGANGKEVVKVRCGVDLARRIKSSKSASYVKSKGEKLTEVRTDFVSLPQPMLRLEALQFALSAPEFQSADDQALIQDAIDNRVASRGVRAKTVKAPAAKTVRVRAKKSDLNLDTIKTRARKSKRADTTAEQVLAALADQPTDTQPNTDAAAV